MDNQKINESLDKIHLQLIEVAKILDKYEEYPNECINGIIITLVIGSIQDRYKIKEGVGAVLVMCTSIYKAMSISSELANSFFEALLKGES